MSRLTAKKEDRYFENEEFWVDAEQPSIDKIDDVYFKLAEFEDLMEEYGLHNVEQIKDLITANQDDRDELCYLAEENKMLKDRWQKLKEWFKDKEWDACTSRDRALSKMEELEKEDL